MAHYALIDDNNIVTQVFVGKDENETLPEGFASWEQYYCPPTAKACLRTSYNTTCGIHKNGGQPFRKNYAGIGFMYDEQLNAFIPPKPHPSWILESQSGTWQAPIQQPGDNYTWSEETLSWVLID